MTTNIDIPLVLIITRIPLSNLRHRFELTYPHQAIDIPKASLLFTAGISRLVQNNYFFLAGFGGVEAVLGTWSLALSQASKKIGDVLIVLMKSEIGIAE